MAEPGTELFSVIHRNYRDPCADDRLPRSLADPAGTKRNGAKPASCWIRCWKKTRPGAR